MVDHQCGSVPTHRKHADSVTKTAPRSRGLALWRWRLAVRFPASSMPLAKTRAQSNAANDYCQQPSLSGRSRSVSGSGHLKYRRLIESTCGLARISPMAARSHHPPRMVSELLYASGCPVGPKPIPEQERRKREHDSEEDPVEHLGHGSLLRFVRFQLAFGAADPSASFRSSTTSSPE